MENRYRVGKGVGRIEVAASVDCRPPGIEQVREDSDELATRTRQRINNDGSGLPRGREIDSTACAVAIAPLERAQEFVLVGVEALKELLVRGVGVLPSTH